jgi:hypothetical protein
MKRLLFLGIMAPVILLFAARPVLATSIEPLLFEELVLNADFVGIVECETAGGIVARYKVLESWKGPKTGEKVALHVGVDYWDSQFPIALCGERYFVTAFYNPPQNLIATSSLGGVPLWWRRIPADFRLPLHQGRWLLDGKKEDETRRQKAKNLLALKPAEQEMELLQVVIGRHFFGDRWIGGEKDPKKAEQLRLELAALKAPDKLVHKLLELAQADPKKWAVRTRIVLEKAGRSITLKELEKLPLEKAPWNKDDFAYLKWEMKVKLGLQKREPIQREPDDSKDKVPTEARLAQMRETLTGKPESREFGKALELLTLHDPGPVAEYLMRWTDPKDDSRMQGLGYVLGSYFAWRCGKDRERHLQKLLGAKDEYIQVAGAVYLCFENEKLGIQELTKLAKGKGDPALWANLTLARRGHKEAVPRLLEAFPKDAKSEEEMDERKGMARFQFENMRLRILVLLSNAARAGNVPQPPRAGTREEMTRWWQENQGKIVLRNPWLELLAKQKID